MMINRPFISVLILILFSCGVEAKLYKINKGSHDSANFNSGSFARMQHMHFQAVFNETAIYEVDEADAGDENKLYGFSDCGDHHLRNSARFGWVWNSDKSQLEIYGYTHMYGDHYSKFIGVAELNKPYTYEIKLSGNEYIFRFNGEKITMPRGCDSKNTSVLSYKLGPYFGGTNKAPHDIYIYIDELDADNDEEILPIGIVNIYPNPACEEAYVALENYSDKTEVVKLRVYGLDGKLVLTTDEIIAAPLCTFTQLMIISTLDNGYYMVTVSNSLDEIGLTDDLTVAKKIIKACTKNNDGMRQKLH